MKDLNGKTVNWEFGKVGFLFGIYEDLTSGEKMLGFQKCAYLAEFPDLKEDGDYLKYTDNQLYPSTRQMQVRMLYGFRITKLKCE